MNDIQVFLATYAHPIIWLAVALVMLIAEAATVQMVSIWFCLGAVAAAIAAILGGNVPVQVVVFVVVSGLTLAFTRKFVKKVLRVKKTPTNADSVIGAIGQVTEPIDDEAGTGRIKVEAIGVGGVPFDAELGFGRCVEAGMDWSARTTDGSKLPEGVKVKVKAIAGVKLMVSPIREKED